MKSTKRATWTETDKEIVEKKDAHTNTDIQEGKETRDMNLGVQNWSLFKVNSTAERMMDREQRCQSAASSNLKSDIQSAEVVEQPAVKENGVSNSTTQDSNRYSTRKQSQLGNRSSVVVSNSKNTSE